MNNPRKNALLAAKRAVQDGATLNDLEDINPYKQRIRKLGRVIDPYKPLRLETLSAQFEAEFIHRIKENEECEKWMQPSQDSCTCQNQESR